MAEGIKINQLPILNKVTGSDIAVVVDHNDSNRTKQVYLSAIANYITPGSAIDITQINNSINNLTSNVYNISNIIDIMSMANVETFNEINNKLYDLSVNSNNNIQEIQSYLENVDISLRVLSSLIDDPELLSSLEEIIDQLRGEDGEASIANLIMHVADISSKIDDVIPRLRTIENGLIKNLDNICERSFSDDYNSIVINNVNDSYEYMYDKNRFANLNSSSSFWYTSAYISGTNISTGLTTTIDLSGVIILPSDLTTDRDYTETITSNETTLSNYAIEEVVGLSTVDKVYYQITSYLDTQRNEDADSGLSTIRTTIENTTVGSEPQAVQGESTFNLDSIPIRAGMFTDIRSIQLQISGTSDIDFYWIKNSNIINGKDSVISVMLENELIAKRKSTSSMINCKDTDLDLVFSKRIKGGKHITLVLDNSDNSKINTYNLVGAICPRRMSYEGDPLNIEILTANFNYNTNNAISGLDIEFKVTGGYTGDYYKLSGLYNNVGLEFPEDNSFYNIDNDILETTTKIENIKTNNANSGGIAIIYLLNADTNKIVAFSESFQL